MRVAARLTRGLFLFGEIMSQHKFTADGRKVVVVGKLNAQETIVQEVFVRDECEFPAGENFVVKSLLDQPAESWKKKEEARLEVSLEKMKAEYNKVSVELSRFQVFQKAAMDSKIKWTKGVTQPEVDIAVERIRSFLTGEYTHIVIPGYTVEILEFNAELFAYAESGGYREGRRLEGIQLVSLWGAAYNNERRGMTWRVNRWRDGSGSDSEFIPCRSLEEAKQEAFKVIDDREHLRDEDYDFCVKYGIEVNAEKNAKRLSAKIRYLREQIQDFDKKKAEAEAKASEIESTFGGVK